MTSLFGWFRTKFPERPGEPASYGKVAKTALLSQITGLQDDHMRQSTAYAGLACGHSDLTQLMRRSIVKV